jgi:hypothetical protein
LQSYEYFFITLFHLTEERVLFFGCAERLHCRIPAAAWLFVRGLLAAGWRQCCVQRIPFFYFFLFFCRRHNSFFIFCSRKNGSLLILSFYTPLSIFASFDHFSLKIAPFSSNICIGSFISPHYFCIYTIS